jgi:hypothetical protein
MSPTFDTVVREVSVVLETGLLADPDPDGAGTIRTRVPERSKVYAGLHGCLASENEITLHVEETWPAVGL